MDASALLEDLRSRGIRLEVHDGRLRYLLRSAATPGLIEQLKENKSELLAILSSTEDYGVCDHCQSRLIGQPTFDGYTNRRCPKCGTRYRCVSGTRTYDGQDGRGGHDLAGNCAAVADFGAMASAKQLPLFVKPVAERAESSPTRAKIRPPIKWYGGKHYLADRIVAELPPHRIYVEPFGGGASVLLNKAPAEVEVYSDLHGELANLFRVLRDSPKEFHRLLSLTPYSRAEFEDCRIVDGQDPIERARQFYVRCRQSFSGRGQSWSATTKRSRRGMADVVSGWWSSIDDNLLAVIDRLQRVQIECMDVLKCIQKYDDPEAVIYCDPPYEHSTRAAGSRAAYDHEMSQDDHRRLATVLHECQGAVVLSGYPSELYSELYHDWRTVEFYLPNNAAGGKTKRRQTEKLWINRG